MKTKIRKPTRKVVGNAAYVYIDLANTDAITAVQQRVMDAMENVGGIEWQPPATFHITLTYVKDISDDALADIEPPDFSTLDIRAGSLSLFNNPGSRALVLAVDHTPELDALQRAVYQSFEGFERSDFSKPEAYQPHITLAYMDSSGVDVPSVEFEPLSITAGTVQYARGEYEPVMTVTASDPTPERSLREKLRLAVGWQRASSPPVRFLSDGRVQGYLVRFTDPDERDLYGEYFNEETDFQFEGFPVKGAPVLYQHGLDEVAETAVLGNVKTVEVRENPDEDGNRGVWIEAQLDMMNDYVQMIRDVHKAAMKKFGRGLGFSSGALPSTVRVDDETGHILRWGIVEGSLTLTPADPGNQVTTMRSLATLYDDLLRERNAREAGEQDPKQASIDKQSARKAKMDKLQEMVDAFVANLIDMMREDMNDMSDDDAERMDGEDDEPLRMDEEDEEAMQQAAERRAVALLKKAKAVMDAEGDAEKVEQAQRVLEKKTAEIARVATDAYYEQRRRRQMRQGMTSAAKARRGTAKKWQVGGASEQAARENQRGNGIEVYGKWHNATAEDMSYYAMVKSFKQRQNGGGRWTPDQKFMRELSDKVVSGYQKRKLDVPDTTIRSAHAIKADELDYSTQVGFGDEWVPELWSDQVWRRARLENRILPLFRSLEMPSDPYKLPVEGSDPSVYHVPETQDESELTLSGSGNPIPDSKLGTNNVTISASKLGLRMGMSLELVEDAIIDVVAMAREQAQRAIMDAIDNVLLNGDTETDATGNINSDDSAPAAGSKYLAFDGILKSALVDDASRSVDGGGTAITLSKIRNMRFAMPTQYAQRPADLAYIVGGEVFASLLDLDAFLTMDKVGDQATILSGMIGTIDGTPVITSAEFGLAEADGKQSATPANNTLGRMATVFRPNWYVGYRRRVTPHIDYLSYYDSYQMTVTVRLGFVPQNDDSASVLYNLLV